MKRVLYAILLSLGLILGAIGGQGIFKQGNDVTFYLWEKRTLVSAWGHCESRSQELSLISVYAYLGKR